MNPIASFLSTQAIQGVRSLLRSDEVSTEPKTEAKTEVSKEISSDFEAILKAHLTPDAENSIDEEELYSAILGERIKQAKGEDAFNRYKEELAIARTANTRSDGVIAEETAANQALAALVSDETVTKEEMGQIKAAAFKSSQLDDNENALFDGRGGSGDNTVAVMNMEEALKKAKAVLEKIKSGEVDLTTAAVDGETITPNGNEIDGDGGFLFKPVSDTTGNLVLVMSSAYSHMISSVVLKNSADEIIETGVSKGFGNPDDGGERDHYKFTKPGSSYEKDLTVEMTLNDGKVVKYKIPDPSQRYD